MGRRIALQEESLYIPEIFLMTVSAIKSLSRNALVLAGIIVVVRIILYLPYLRIPADARRIINLIYPPNLLEMLGKLVGAASGEDLLHNFPFFSLAFAVCLIFAAARLRMKGKTRFLKVCYYLLIICCVLAIPVSLYLISVINEYYSKHIPSMTPPVPSQTMMIINIIVLLVYSFWSGWQIRQLKKMPTRLIDEALASFD